MAEGKIYIARKDGLCEVDGNWLTLKAGVTRVREGHPLLKGREEMFEEMRVHYDLEDARSAPEQEKPEPVPAPVPDTPVGDKPDPPDTADKPSGMTTADVPSKPVRRGSRRNPTTRTD